MGYWDSVFGSKTKNQQTSAGEVKSPKAIQGNQGRREVKIEDDVDYTVDGGRLVLSEAFTEALLGALTDESCNGTIGSMLRVLRDKGQGGYESVLGRMDVSLRGKVRAGDFYVWSKEGGVIELKEWLDKRGAVWRPGKREVSGNTEGWWNHIGEFTVQDLVDHLHKLR